MQPSGTTEAAVERLRDALLVWALAVREPPGAAAHDHAEFQRTMAVLASQALRALEDVFDLANPPPGRH